MARDLEQVLNGNFGALALPAGALQELQRLTRAKRLAAGETLFAQGQRTQAFYAVLQGEIEARLNSADGQASVLEHVRAPRLFGLAAFVTGQRSNYEAVARRASRVLVFGPEAYRYAMDELPGFARALMREFALRYDGTLRLLEAARHRSAPERFELALAQLRRERGAGLTPDAEGWLEFRATQAELAALANVSRQTVNQLLRAAAAAGRLRLAYGRLTVRDGVPA
ncbi:Crp/Fnr family transcriptional regulator [Paucibacter soli]|uniref:Crp/Fnr family transcriptional regulator n=1 Tax=Paucibacter soli TaxID=3133433 RepID=UPI0030ABC6BB